MNRSHSDEFVTCMICKKEYSFLGSHIKVHDITIAEYKKRFPNSKLCSDELCGRNSKSHKGRPAHNKGVTKHQNPNMGGWSKRRKNFPDNSPNKRAVETKRQKYGPSCVNNPEERTKKIKQVSKIASKKRWKTRRENCGKDFPYKISKEKLLRRNPSTFEKGCIPWNKGLTKETDKRLRANNSWKNYTPEEKERRILNSIVRSQERPNGLEKRLCNIVKEFDLPLVYTGAFPYPGLNGKRPDFVSTDGSKKILEAFGDYWHRNDNPQDRINMFKELGYDCLVLWEHEIYEKSAKEIVRIVSDFLNSD